MSFRMRPQTQLTNANSTFGDTSGQPTTGDGLGKTSATGVTSGQVNIEKKLGVA